MTKIHLDYVSAASYHTFVSINFKEIVDDYSEQTWISMKEELSSKGTEFVFDDGTNAYFSVDCSDSAYLYIEASWHEAISKCRSIETDDE